MFQTEQKTLRRVWVLGTDPPALLPLLRGGTQGLAPLRNHRGLYLHRFGRCLSISYQESWWLLQRPARCQRCFCKLQDPAQTAGSLRLLTGFALLEMGLFVTKYEPQSPRFNPLKHPDVCSGCVLEEGGPAFCKSLLGRNRQSPSFNQSLIDTWLRRAQ